MFSGALCQEVMTGKKFGSVHFISVCGKKTAFLNSIEIQSGVNLFCKVVVARS
jgi:hypothetical protein